MRLDNHICHVNIAGCDYSISVVHVAQTKRSKIYFLKSFRGEELLAEAFVTSMNSLDLYEQLNIPAFDMSRSEKNQLMSDLKRVALDVISSDKSPAFEDFCQIIFKQDISATAKNPGLTICCSKDYDSKNVLEEIFRLNPGISDIAFIETLATPIKTRIKGCPDSGLLGSDYTLIVVSERCTYKTTMLNLMCNLAYDRRKAYFKINDFVSIGALISKSHEFYDLPLIVDDVAFKGVYRQSSICRRKEDFDCLVTYNAEENCSTNIVLAAETIHGMGRAATLDRLFMISAGTYSEDELEGIGLRVKAIKHSDICGLYIDFYMSLLKSFDINWFKELYEKSDFTDHVKTQSRYRVGRHARFIFTVWKLFCELMLPNSDTSTLTTTLIQHLESAVRQQEALLAKISADEALDYAFETWKVIKGESLKKYTDEHLYEKEIMMVNTFYQNPISNIVYIRLKTLKNAIERNTERTVSGNRITDDLEKLADCITRTSDNKRTKEFLKYRHVIIDFATLEKYVLSRNPS